MGLKYKTLFQYLDEARHEAGFFVRQACEKLGISERTWYRWQASGKAPKWAVRHLEILSGRLDHLGWKTMYIKRGVLYSRDLNPKYYNWEASDLLFTAFCKCPAHVQMRENRREAIEAEASRDTAGGAKVAPTRRLSGASAPALHLPGSIGRCAAG